MAEKISKYEYVKQSIQKKIADHEWKGNQVIPSENKLCEYYQVSRITIRRAMDELVHEGVLYRIKGKGCFVREKETDKLSHIYSFTEAILLQGKQPSKQQISFSKEPAGTEIAAKMGLPIVMGVSFTFLGSLLMICTNPELGYEGMVGAVILGGIFEGLVGLSARYWKRFLTPIVSACVVVAIGLSLLPVGMDSWGGGTGSETFGAWYHLLVGAMTLIVCLVSRYLLKGVYKNLNILVGLVFGYVISAVFTAAGIAPMIDFSGITKTIGEVGYFSLPKLVFLTGHKPVFDIGAFCTIAIVFLVSAAETTGATTAVCKGTLDRDIKMEELQGSLAVDGFSSAISGCFGCLPLTSFSQNVGLVTMTGVINRFTILMGALILILASLFPPLGAFFNSLPQSVLGGCTVMMFGSIMYEGVKMMKDCEFNDRTMIIVSLAFCVGVGLTQTSGNFFAAFPQPVGDIFNGNAVAGVFVVSLLLSLFLPKQKTETA